MGGAIYGESVFEVRFGTLLYGYRVIGVCCIKKHFFSLLFFLGQIFCSHQVLRMREKRERRETLLSDGKKRGKEMQRRENGKNAGRGLRFFLLQLIYG